MTIFGIQIRIHSSLIFLVAYLVLVTSLQFPLLIRDSGVNPLLLSMGPVSWSFILSISLMLSVLVHELGHALTAQAFGLKVRSITLMMLGGISSVERMPEKASSELILAIAGPLVSLSIFGIGSFIQHHSQSPNLIFFTHWLSQTNLVLAIFNLLPAFPLDGGRVLRAALSMRFGIVRATQLAVRVSHVFAIILGVLGFLSFNIFLILVAFFIYAGAQAEATMTFSKTRLTGVAAGPLVQRISPIGETASVAEAAQRMRELRQPILPVLSKQNTPALITLEQILRVPRTQWESTPIHGVMEEVASFAEFNEPLAQFFEAIATSRSGALPVRQNGEVIGIIRYSDLALAAGLQSLEEKPSEEPPRSDKKAA